MLQRAIDTEDKALRRADILSAARKLFLEDSRQLPSAASIARESGLAKGTVYLYFRTKEEIFVALLAEDFAGVLNAVIETFSGTWQTEGIAGFINRYVTYLDSRPEFLRLDAMSYSVLEQNMGDDQLRSFKLDLTRALVAAGRVLDNALGLVPGRGVTLLLRTYAITRGLWQSLDFPPTMRALLADPEFAPIRPNFRTELVEALNEYWRGAMQTN